MKRIALLGMPNTGKSTLFNRLSGASARVGNWPGITVDLMSAKILMGGHIAELIDLPGLYDLHGFSDDEQVVRHFLSNNTVDLAMIVLNSSQIDRQLSLALQIRNLGMPTILLLNMQDEAKRAGITIDTEAMSNQLGFPVLQISAKYGDGCPQALIAAAKQVSDKPQCVSPQTIAGSADWCVISRLHLTSPAYTGEFPSPGFEKNAMALISSFPEDLNQIPNLFIHFFEATQGAGDFTAQNIPVAQPQPVHGGLDRALGQAERPAQLRVTPLAPLSRLKVFQLLEQFTFTFIDVLLP